MNGGRGEVHIGFWWENLMKRAHVADMSRWEDYIKLGLKAIFLEDMDGVGQAQDRVKYWAVVEMVMNIRIL
jgi:hypothetical protein